MECKVFSKNVKDLIIGEILEKQREDMVQHMKNCDSCKHLYQQEKEIYHSLRSVANVENVGFEISSLDILSNLDKTRYCTKRTNKLLHFLRRNSFKYAASFMVLILAGLITVFVIHNLNSNRGKNTMTHKPDNSVAPAANKEEVQQAKETIIKLINKYYIVTKEDVAMAKHEGFVTEEEAKNIDKAMIEYHRYMAEIMTIDVLNVFIGNRNWIMRAATVIEPDFTVEVRNINIGEGIKKEDMLYFPSTFTLTKKNINGEIVAEKNFSKDFYLSKESGIWKINTKTSVGVNTKDFLNFN